MEHKNDNQIRDYDAVLDAKYGAPGTPERAQFEAEAEAFYSGQLLRDVRKEAGIVHYLIFQQFRNGLNDPGSTDPYGRGFITDGTDKGFFLPYLHL